MFFERSPLRLPPASRLHVGDKHTFSGRFKRFSSVRHRAGQIMSCISNGPLTGCWLQAASSAAIGLKVVAMTSTMNLRSSPSSQVGRADLSST